MKKYFKSLLVLVIAAVFVPVVKAEDVQTISEVNVTIASPTAGQKLEKISSKCSYYDYNTEQDVEYDCTVPSIYPTVTFGEETYHIGDGGKAFYISSYPSEAPAEDPYSYDEIPEVTFTEGNDYVVEVYLVPNEGYVFAEDVVLKVNGVTTNYELSDWNGPAQLMFYAKVKAKTAEDAKTEDTKTEETKTEETKTEEAKTEDKTETTTSSTTTYKVLDGDKQTYKTSSDENLTFRFDIAYAEFKESGKVYMDNELVDAENYSTKEGSTYVIFTKAYTKNLKAGEHTMKVTTANGEATTSFTIEAAEVASSNKTTSNPQTGDSIHVYVALLVLSVLGFVSLNLFNKKVNE